MYYIPIENTFVLENIHHAPVELVKKSKVFWRAEPGERRTFKKGELKLYEEVNFMSRMFVHTGCMAFAVEVDGMRYEYCPITFKNVITQIDKYLGENPMEMTVKEVEQRLGIKGLKIVKEKPMHKWKHGDVFKAYDDTILICINDTNSSYQAKNGLCVFGIDKDSGCYGHEYITDVNLDDEAIFLFNVSDKLEN